MYQPISLAHKVVDETPSCFGLFDSDINTMQVKPEKNPFFFVISLGGLTVLFGCVATAWPLQIKQFKFPRELETFRLGWNKVPVFVREQTEFY